MTNERMRVVKTDDLVLLYHPETQSWLGPADLVVSETNPKHLRAIPTLTKDPQKATAVLLQDAFPLSPDKSIHPGRSFRIRTLEDNTGSSTFLSPSQTAGNRLIFGEALSGQIDWVASPTDANADVSTVWYGVDYSIKNNLNSLFLTLERSELALGENSTVWRFIPTVPVYICDTTVDQCISSENTDNASIGLQCDAKKIGGGGCRDKFGRRVYADLQICSRECGRDDDAQLLSSTQASGWGTSGKKGAAPDVGSIVAITFLSAIGLIGIVLIVVVVARSFRGRRYF